jgi:hypothetical protein
MPPMTQPEAMQTRAYLYGVEKVNGYDAWALFKASALGDVSKVEALLAKDGQLANAQCGYEFPIHWAVREGHSEVVKLLLAAGADPGQSRFTYNSWDKLLTIARERGFGQVEKLLLRAMKKRFNYSPEFGLLKEAIVGRSSGKIDAILKRLPKLAFASDELGNNAIHWSVITRQLSLLRRFAEFGTRCRHRTATSSRNRQPRPRLRAPSNHYGLVKAACSAFPSASR